MFLYIYISIQIDRYIDRNVSLIRAWDDRNMLCLLGGRAGNMFIYMLTELFRFFWGVGR